MVRGLTSCWRGTGSTQAGFPHSHGPAEGDPTASSTQSLNLVSCCHWLPFVASGCLPNLKSSFPGAPARTPAQERWVWGDLCPGLYPGQSSVTGHLLCARHLGGLGEGGESALQMEGPIVGHCSPKASAEPKAKGPHTSAWGRGGRSALAEMLSRGGRSHTENLSRALGQLSLWGMG